MTDFPFKLRIAVLTAAMASVAMCWSAPDNKLVIMHTNDTHSQIEPSDDGLGGVARRKTLIDSIRAAEPNTLLVDAGDMVQGTLYYYLYKGDVENGVADLLGYDMRILGNHEFDNGAEDWAHRIRNTKSTWLSTNYDLRGSKMADKFVPYTIREVDGRRIGFMGLNLDPKGIISPGNYNGVKYNDLYEAANLTAKFLKDVEHCDMVVALTHIGYAPTKTGTSDLELAAKSKDIDIIIGGHSHTVAGPVPDGKPWRIPNAEGDTILVTQTGRRGYNLGLVTIDLDNLKTDYRLIPVDKRLDSVRQPAVDSLLAIPRQSVDSLMRLPVGKSAIRFDQSGEPAINLLSDLVDRRGSELTGRPVDLAILNRGGIRQSLPKGTVTEGEVINMVPFSNYIVVLEISGKDLYDAFDNMADTVGFGTSYKARATYSPKTKKPISITINGKPLDPDKTYTVATIDYLANGGDYMDPLTNGRVIARSPNYLYTDFLNWIRNDMKGKKLKADDVQRMRPVD
ncbi:MAG: bifunctional metallophosphatase/5'-nucleotidase [Muribaculaceae bacterium]